MVRGLIVLAKFACSSSTRLILCPRVLRGSEFGLRLQHLQPRGGAADRAADVDVVAGARAAPRERLPALHAADHGDVDDQRSGRACQVAAGDVQSVLGRKRRDAGDDGVEVVEREIRRERERQEREARRRAHRRQIAEVGGERAVADRPGGCERAIEMDALDERVHAQHFRAVPLRLDHGGIVADSDEHPRRRRREVRPNEGDQLAFGAIADAPGRVVRVTWHSRRPVSPESPSP